MKLWFCRRDDEIKYGLKNSVALKVNQFFLRNKTRPARLIPAQRRSAMSENSGTAPVVDGVGVASEL